LLKKTKNGKVILQMIRILDFRSQEHGMKHIVTPEFELYGCYLAGTPFPLLGHNRDYATLCLKMMILISIEK
jgi:penicillin amidase